VDFQPRKFVGDTEISVEIQAASFSDKGKGIARLDINSMRCLGIPSGGIIEIQGQRKTYAKCLQSTKEDTIPGILNIDELMCSNAGIGIGSRIYVKRIPVAKARSVTISPLEITSFVEESEIKEAMKLFPIIQDSNVAFESLGEYVFFRILETIPPSRPLIVTSDTEIRIKDYYFLEPDKKSEDVEENPELVITDEEFTEEEFLQIKADFER
jgi:transitional endoplasmic reticulum ATPase